MQHGHDDSGCDMSGTNQCEEQVLADRHLQATKLSVYLKSCGEESCRTYIH